MDTVPQGVFALSGALDERLYKAGALLTCLVVKGHPSCAGDEAAARHLGRRPTDLLGADDLDAKGIELWIRYEEADALRKVTPRSTTPEQHARELILKAVKTAG